MTTRPRWWDTSPGEDGWPVGWVHCACVTTPGDISRSAPASPTCSAPRPPALGTRVTFTHRGRTPDWLPRFASYLRQRTH